MAVTSETLTVAGMHCTGCEQAIERAITPLLGVHSVKADHLQGSVRVDYDPTIVQRSAAQSNLLFVIQVIHP